MYRIVEVTDEEAVPDTISLKEARHLLQVLKFERLVLDWRKRQQTRAQVLNTIRDILDEDLPRSYTTELYNQKCDIVYQHVYDSYYGPEMSVY